MCTINIKTAKLLLSLVLIISSALTVHSFTPQRVSTRRYSPVSPIKAKESKEEKLSKEEKNKLLVEKLQTQYPDYEGRISFQQGNQSQQQHRCGFISLIGAPNMGKSTLLNAILQEKLCTATHRPQTTRHAILGILNSEEQACQLCFQDTPGVIDDPAYKLQEGMMEAVKGAFFDSDVILVVTDLFSTPIPDDVLFEKVLKSDKKVIVAINKIDLADKVNKNSDQKEMQVHRKGDEDDMSQCYKRTVTIEDAVKNWRELVPSASAVIPLIASDGGDDPGVTALRSLLLGGPDVPKAIRDLGRPISGMFPTDEMKFISNEEALEIIPVGPPLYDEDTLTDRTERFFVSEIIRATLFVAFGKELPYCCEVRIEEFREPKPGDKKKITQIAANICVERDSQKGIVVGKGGQKIKEVGMQARKELEEFLQEKVHLRLNVKVDKNWRKDEKRLKAYGYLK